jgi:hypothetical protein
VQADIKNKIWVRRKLAVIFVANTEKNNESIAQLKENVFLPLLYISSFFTS